MNIGEAAAAAGLPAKTIRFYEEIGLVRPARSGNGYRDFGASDVARLSFIARARGLGFSVEDCRALLSLWTDRDRASSDVKHLAEARLEDVDRKIAELKGLRATLSHLIDECHGDTRSDCPILDQLSS